MRIRRSWRVLVPNNQALFSKPLEDFQGKALPFDRDMLARVLKQFKDRDVERALVISGGVCIIGDPSR